MKHVSLSRNRRLPVASPQDPAKIRGANRVSIPPAEPGALGIGPLEAAFRVADAALHSLAT
jgi:hypothetical protein